jgi:tetrahydromethanopterin S-methyltransferase subunit G
MSHLGWNLFLRKGFIDKGPSSRDERINHPVVVEMGRWTDNIDFPAKKVSIDLSIILGVVIGISINMMAWLTG